MTYLIVILYVIGYVFGYSIFKKSVGSDSYDWTLSDRLWGLVAASLSWLAVLIGFIVLFLQKHENKIDRFFNKKASW